MKYRKRPIIVEAERFEPPVIGNLTHYLNRLGVFDFHGVDSEGYQAFGYIKTLEGNAVVRDGDWIITGVLGEKYPCNHEVFMKTYEPVEEL